MGASKRGAGGGALVRCKEHEAAKTGGVVVNCGGVGCKDGGGGCGNGDGCGACGGSAATGAGADGNKKPVSPRLEKWMQTWKTLGEECQRAVLLIMNDKLKYDYCTLKARQVLTADSFFLPAGKRRMLFLVVTAFARSARPW